MNHLPASQIQNPDHIHTAITSTYTYTYTYTHTYTLIPDTWGLVRLPLYL
jgi:hypothetical protein